MVELLKSITEKIKIIKKNKLNKFHIKAMYCFIFSPYLLNFLIDTNKGIENLLIITFSIVMSLICLIILCKRNIIAEIYSIVNKKKLFKIINEKERELLEQKKIDFSLFNIEETLFDIQTLCIDSIESEKELLEIVSFILSNTEYSKEYKIKTIKYVENNKYYNAKLIDLIYTEENDFKIYNSSEEIKQYVFDFIYNKSTFSQISKYKEYENQLSPERIVVKIITAFDFKTIIKLIFEKNKHKLIEKELELYDFFNNLEVEKLVNIKKIILDKTLYLKEESNVEDYKEEFIDLSKRLDVDKKLLYLMEEKLNKKEERLLNIINM